MSPGTMVTTPISCKLCNKIFPVPAGVVLNSTPDQQTANFVKRLAVHLKERHAGAQMTAALAGAEYTGMLTLMYFNLSGSVESQRDYLRWKIQTQTRRAYVTDERIDQRIRSMLTGKMTAPEIHASMTTPGEIGFEIFRVMRDMRDVLTEAGRYEIPAMQPAAAAPN